MSGRLKIAAVLAVAAALATAVVAGTSDKRRGDDEACLAKNSSLLDKLRETLEEGSKCETDSDCQVVSLMMCPLGCYAAVMKKNVERARQAIADTSARLDRACQCEYKCAPAPKSASCVTGHCTVRGRQ
jgi:hypothetical protein